MEILSLIWTVASKLIVWKCHQVLLGAPSSGGGGCLQVQASVLTLPFWISVQYIFIFILTFTHTHSLTALQLLRSRVVIRKTSEKHFWNWVQRVTRSWLVRGLELSQHEQSGNKGGRCRPFSWMEGFDVQTSATCLSISLEVCDEVWKSELWKPFLWFSYDSRIHYKNIYVGQYRDFSKEMIYNCHRFLRGGSYISDDYLSNILTNYSH